MSALDSSAVASLRGDLLNAAAQMGLSLEDGTVDRLLAYLSLLQRWTRRWAER